MMRILKEQRGSVTLIVALAMVVLLGFAALVVDVGIMYWTRAQLVNEADSAALAGAQLLPVGMSQAADTAWDYAINKNGQPGDTVNLIIGNGNTSLTVNVSRTINLLFARVFGYTTKNVTATATAAVSGVGGSTNTAPLGIPKQNFIYDQPYELKTGSGGGGSGSGAIKGNYQALALGGTGSTVYGDNLDHGYKGTLWVDQWVETEPGAKVGDTTKAIDDRIQRDDRTVIVPIIDPNTMKSVNGRDVVQIVGFAAFYLDSVDGNGRIYGNFRGYYSSSNTIPGNSPNYGLYNLRLTQ